MIRRFEALNYRSLRYICQDLSDFHILVGANASGKSTLLDAIRFLHDVLTDGPAAAVEKRTPNFYDLLFEGKGESFELAVEVELPEDPQQSVNAVRVRYEVTVGIVDNAIDIEKERLLRVNGPPECGAKTDATEPPQTLVLSDSSRVLSASISGGRNTINGVPATSLSTNRWGSGSEGGRLAYHLGRIGSALALDGKALQRISPPGRGTQILPDGSNLPWAIQANLQKHPESHKEWLAHVRTALPDLEDVDTGEIPDIRNRYTRLHYRNGLVVPSWGASEGTLRLLALTLLAYLPDLEGVIMIEEPENGLHPLAMESVLDSLRSVYGGQVLLATHSPTILGLAKPEEILCFQNTAGRGTSIVRGDRHPGLQQWYGTMRLDDIFASGILGR